MWPFKNLALSNTLKPPEGRIYIQVIPPIDYWDQIIKLFPIGRQFVWLGCKLRVAKHLKHEITAEYVDNNGKLYEWVYWPSHIPILLIIDKENKESN